MTDPAPQGRTGDLQRALFVWQMNKAKDNVKPETKARLWGDLVQACREVADADLMNAGEAKRNARWQAKFDELCPPGKMYFLNESYMVHE